MKKAIYRGITNLPEDTDLIVGIPRSGMLAANIMALLLNVRFTDLDGLVNNRIMQNGMTRPISKSVNNIDECRKILVIDDSVCSGGSLREVKKIIDGLGSIKSRVLYGAVFVTEENKNLVDFYFDVCPMPRVFEWNLLHHDIITGSCFDLDGVLCLDPSEEQDDDGEKYIEFIKSARPFLVSDVTIGTIVSCRLEKYRGLTEEWLKNNHISYNNLVMMNYSSKQERLAAGKHASYKAGQYVRSNSMLFVESSCGQAAEIARLSGKPVYCVETMEYITPEISLLSPYIQTRNFAVRCRRKLKKIFTKK
jgi:orotate phosphoribosyltransferase